MHGGSMVSGGFAAFLEHAREDLASPSVGPVSAVSHRRRSQSTNTPCRGCVMRRVFGWSLIAVVCLGSLQAVTPLLVCFAPTIPAGMTLRGSRAARGEVAEEMNP